MEIPLQLTPSNNNNFLFNNYTIKNKKNQYKMTLICRSMSTIDVKNRISCIIKTANKLTRKELSFEDITEYNINKEVKYYTEKSTEFAIECIIEI